MDKAEDSNKSPLELTAATGQANEANHKMLRNVRVTVIGPDVDVRKDKTGMADGTGKPGASNTLPEDPFGAHGLMGKIIEPPFDMLTLAMLSEHNGELGQCIEAMEVNCDATGHRFVSRLKLDNEGKATGGQPSIEKAVESERVRLQNFFAYATREPFTAFRRRLRNDKEATGNAYFEVLRDADGAIQGFTHIPAYQMRLGILCEDELLVTRKVLELQEDGSVLVKNRKEWRRFRPFVQSRAIFRSNLRLAAGGYKVRWFKEFGDPRPMDRDTGEYTKEMPAQPGSTDVTYGPLPEGRLPATEVVHLRLYSGRTPYGLPRYIGNLLSIFGDRAAEEINYMTFRNNNIPSQMITISNGTLTQASIDRLKSFSESNIQGSDNYSKFVIIEGEPFETDNGEDGGQVKIDTKSLTKDQRTDEMFTTYRASNADRTRRSFRLPPVFVGATQEYSYATIQAARSLGDEQVFAPERETIDDLINRDLFPEMGIMYHQFKSNTPNTTDNMALVKIVAGAEKTGGMTPRIARRALEEILGQNLPAFPEDFPADVPFSLTMAQAVKNQADAAEPGQQVTALKAMGILGDDMEILIEDDDDNVAIAKKLMTLQSSVEAIWREQRKVG